MSGQRLRGHAPKERKIVARTVTSPARRGSNGGQQGEQKRKVLVPVAQHDGPLESWAADEDVPRRCGLGGDGDHGGGQRDRNDSAYANHYRIIPLAHRG